MGNIFDRHLKPLVFAPPGGVESTVAKEEAMPTTSDLKKGVRIELEGEPYAVVESSTQTPSARGAATLVKVKLRNLKTKQLINH